MKYAGICTDMRGVRHFWRKVPEIRRAVRVASGLPKAPGSLEVAGSGFSQASCQRSAINDKGLSQKVQSAASAGEQF